MTDDARCVIEATAGQRAAAARSTSTPLSVQLDTGTIYSIAFIPSYHNNLPSQRNVDVVVTNKDTVV